jgi:hypothetical protein
MMTRKNTMKILAGILLSPALIASSGLLSLRPAQSYPEAFEISLNFPGQPVYYGAPSRTQGGGVRGDDCVAEEASTLTALIPENNVWTTLSDRPTFLWYVPQTKAKTAEFVILDAEDNEIHTKIIDLNNENSGKIIQESLPEDVALETGVYTWQFSLICNPSRRSGDIYIEGWVEQVDFENREAELEQLKTNLEKAGDDTLKQAQAYLNAEIFNESISLLAETRCEHQEEWLGLLNWMGLGELETDTIAQCNE